MSSNSFHPGSGQSIWATILLSGCKLDTIDDRVMVIEHVDIAGDCSDVLAFLQVTAEALYPCPKLMAVCKPVSIVYRNPVRN